MSANQFPDDDTMMVDETDTSGLVPDSDSTVPGLSSGSGTLGATAAHVHRPAPDALVGPSGASLAPLCASTTSLPPIDQVMPTKAYKKSLVDIGEGVARAADLAFASTGVNEARQQVLTAAGIVKLDHDFQETKYWVSEDMSSLSGYAESLRHLQSKKNLWAEGLVTLIAEHGTPELKAGLKDLREKIKTEEAKLDEDWMRKKRRANYPDLAYDTL